jgi:hypothetical protein
VSQRKRPRAMVVWGLSLLVCVGLAVCVHRAARQKPTSPNPPAEPAQPVEPAEPEEPTEPVADAEPPEAPVAPVPSADRVVVDAAPVQTGLTQEDGDAVKAGLLGRLEQSNVEDREYLLESTRSAPVSIEDGHVRIGIWTLEEHDGRLELLLRGPFDPKGAPIWGALVTRQGNHFSVGEVMRGERLRR